MKNRQRIIYSALDLFNKYGERNISTNHIAKHLSISTGNLYYHYSNKEEIIREIFNSYAKEVSYEFSPMKYSSDSSAMLKRYLESVFKLMWKYRFMYINLAEIMDRDELLHQNYLLMQVELRVNLEKIINSFIERRFLKLHVEQLPSFICTLHMIYTKWIPYQSVTLNQMDISQKCIFKGVLQILEVFKLVATEEGLEQLFLLEEVVDFMCK